VKKWDHSPSKSPQFRTVGNSYMVSESPICKNNTRLQRSSLVVEPAILSRAVQPSASCQRASFSSPACDRVSSVLCTHGSSLCLSNAGTRRMKNGPTK
jgi:hypothetical protein